MKYFMLLMIAVGFVVCGVFILLTAGPVWVGWLSIIFFGSMVPLFFWQLIDSRPRLVFDEEGVYDRTLKIGTILWADINGAYIKEIGGNSFICLHIKDPEKYLCNLPPLIRAAVKANEKLGFTPLSLNLSGIGEEPGHILELILKMSAAKNCLGPGS